MALFAVSAAMTGTEFCLVRGEFACLVIADESGDLTAHAGDEPDDRADDRTDRERAGIAHDLAAGIGDLLVLHAQCHEFAPGPAFGEHVNHLRNRKQADQCRDDVDAAGQGRMEDEPRDALDVVIADH